MAPLTAIASHTFTDVPNNVTFHNDIAWITDADVTRGCNPPANDRYFPNDFVTRGQMAAFMNRLANNRVVDAGKLGGLELSEYLTGDRLVTAAVGSGWLPGDQPPTSVDRAVTGVIFSGDGSAVLRSAIR